MSAGSPRQSCPLCDEAGGTLLWRDAKLRVVAVADAEGENYPGFCRVVWQDHVSEMCDLVPTEREHMWRVVHAVESGLRDILQPDKINLASLGNVVAHLHWHVIPRWRDDRNFPNPIWGSPRAGTPPVADAAVWRERQARARLLHQSLAQLLDAQFPW